MGEYVRNDWDGFDSGNQVYDEKKDKNYQARIWICLAIVMGIVLFILVSNLVKEITVLNRGTEFVAEVVQEGRAAKYRDENGTSYYFDLTSFYPRHDGVHVSMYYLDDIYKARPQNTLVSWFGNFGFFGAAFGFCMWRIWKIYKR